MKQYLKMVDVFDCEVESDADLMFSDSLGNIADFSGYKSQCRYAAHAINSHDELMAEVERLRDVISKIKNPSNDDCLDFLCSALRHCDYEINGDFEIGDMKPAFILYANKKGA